MSALKITIYPVDFETPFCLGDCVMSIALLSKEMGLGCELNSSGAVIEGDSLSLREFIRQLGNDALGKLADKVVMIVNFMYECEPNEYIHETDTIKASFPRRNSSLEEMVLEMIG
ncbi:MAG: hypothetical protein ACHQ6U_08570 [Thermodesulfobacteriota bacterium]